MYRNYTQPLSVNTMEITAISLLSKLTLESTYVEFDFITVSFF